MIFKNFFTKNADKITVRRIYESIVAQARRPWFYTSLAVPDTVEGRYEMIVLHSYLVIDRMSGVSSNADDFAQALFDELFRDMDRSLREMGVGDLSVGKKVRKMAEGFYGRAQAYRDALQNADSDENAALKTVLARNIYPGKVPEPILDMLASYVVRARASLDEEPVDAILAGHIGFNDTGSMPHADPNAIS